MQRYAGEFRPADDRPAIPMIFDGWGYVPLEAIAPTKDSQPDQEPGEHEGAPEADSGAR